MIDTPQKHTVFVSPGMKLQFLRYLLMGQSPAPLAESMQAVELAAIYEYMWEKALEIGIRIKGDRFSQADVIKRLKSVEQFKIEVGCAESGRLCLAEECFQKAPECVKLRLKEQFNRLYSIVAEYVAIDYKP